MTRRYITGPSSYIDPEITDVWLRDFDWNIAVHTLTENWEEVMYHKWRRANYLQSGYVQSRPRVLQAYYVKGDNR